MTLFPYLVALWLLAIGLYGIVTSRDLIHLVICLSVVQSSTYVMLLAAGYSHGGIAPVFNNGRIGQPAVDPIVQALVLTDIVVGATVTALLLALAIQVMKRQGSIDPAILRPMKSMMPRDPKTDRTPADRTPAGRTRSGRTQSDRTRSDRTPASRTAS